MSLCLGQVVREVVMSEVEKIVQDFSSARGLTPRDIGVLFGCFGVKFGWPWFTWWFNHLPGPSICPKRTPMPKDVKKDSRKGMIWQWIF